MRFLGNMGISTRTIVWLRENGHDAIHLREQGLQRLPDSEILVKARDENRIILTMDLDFAQLLAIGKETLPSVILFRLEDERSEVVNARLRETLQIATDALASGAIISVDEDSIRVRQLPIR